MTNKPNRADKLLWVLHSLCSTERKFAIEMQFKNPINHIEWQKQPEHVQKCLLILLLFQITSNLYSSLSWLLLVLVSNSICQKKKQCVNNFFPSFNLKMECTSFLFQLWIRWFIYLLSAQAEIIRKHCVRKEPKQWKLACCAHSFQQNNNETDELRAKKVQCP